MTHDDIRRVLLDAVTEEDMREGVRALVAKFKAGDVAAAKVVLPYLIGQPQELTTLTRQSGRPDLRQPAGTGGARSPPRPCPLQVAARHIGVPEGWLRRQAEIGALPALRAGDALLFDVPTVCMALKRRARLPAVKPSAAEAMQELLASSVDILELSVRSANGLHNAGIRLVGELVQRTGVELLRQKNLGARSLREIREVLAENGLALRGELDSPAPS